MPRSWLIRRLLSENAVRVLAFDVDESIDARPQASLVDQIDDRNAFGRETDAFVPHFGISPASCAQMAEIVIAEKKELKRRQEKGSQEIISSVAIVGDNVDQRAVLQNLAIWMRNGRGTCRTRHIHRYLLHWAADANGLVQGNLDAAPILA